MGGGGERKLYLECVLETESTELADGLNVECWEGEEYRVIHIIID